MLSDFIHVDDSLYSLYSSGMSTNARKGVEEARKQLPKLIEAAAAGHATVITRHGRAVAALVPLDDYAPPPQQSLLSIAATGRGLWGRSSGRTIAGLRDEWSR
jgi:prevent-host-death family protein